MALDPCGRNFMSILLSSTQCILEIILDCHEKITGKNKTMVKTFIPSFDREFVKSNTHIILLASV